MENTVKPLYKLRTGIFQDYIIG